MSDKATSGAGVNLGALHEETQWTNGCDLVRRNGTTPKLHAHQIDAVRCHWLVADGHETGPIRTSALGAVSAWNALPVAQVQESSNFIERAARTVQPTAVKRAMRRQRAGGHAAATSGRLAPTSEPEP